MSCILWRTVSFNFLKRWFDSKDLWYVTAELIWSSEYIFNHLCIYLRKDIVSKTTDITSLQHNAFLSFLSDRI